MAVIISWQESWVPASRSTWAAASRALRFWDLAPLGPARRRGVALGVPWASAGVAVVAGVAGGAVAWPGLPFLRVVALASPAAAAAASGAASASLPVPLARRSTVAAPYCLRAFLSASLSLAASTWPRILRS